MKSQSYRPDPQDGYSDLGDYDPEGRAADFTADDAALLDQLFDGTDPEGEAALKEFAEKHIEIVPVSG